jgi:hypothetical protein
MSNVEVNREEEIKQNMLRYRRTIAFAGANVPIECLCLPKPIENILLKEGIVRVYDLLSNDLGKIKGLGKARLLILTSRMDEFFSVSI